MVGINGWEFVLLIVIGVVVLGPERLPEYAAKLGRLVRQARAMAEGARGQLREQMGPEFDEINWRQYDPRQYDPRRIVREALLDPNPVDDAGSGNGTAAGTRSPVEYDGSQPTPYDVDAT
jgi:sec-independent protein translocase protein TatB